MKSHTPKHLPKRARPIPPPSGRDASWVNGSILTADQVKRLLTLLATTN